MHSRDFRAFSFKSKILIDSGKYAGNRFYYKLFVIENMIRIIIHTILKNEFPSHLDWWENGVRSGLKKSWHLLSSHHGVYHVYLEGLNTIMLDNKNQIERHVSDLEELITEIELFNHVRRKIAHTKYLNRRDIERLDKLYVKIKDLIDSISKKFVIEIP